jgi:hypothetical protein
MLVEFHPRLAFALDGILVMLILRQVHNCGCGLKVVIFELVNFERGTVTGTAGALPVPVAFGGLFKACFVLIVWILVQNCVAL